MGKQDLFSSCFPHSAKMYCENEVLKFPPLHMHFNVEMLLWSTACLWCIINIFPLFGCSHNKRLCRLMGKKTPQCNTPGKSLTGFIWHVMHLENCGLSATFTKTPGACRQWLQEISITIGWLNWLKLRRRSQIRVRLQAASPRCSGSSVANQCHDLREMSLSSHSLTCTN